MCIVYLLQWPDVIFVNILAHTLKGLLEGLLVLLRHLALVLPNRSGRTPVALTHGKTQIIGFITDYVNHYPLKYILYLSFDSLARF